MSATNRMEGQFDVIWHKQLDLLSKVRIVNHGMDGITGSVYIPPNNSMEGEIVTQKPPVVTKKYNPVKDLYISEKVPTLNYGKANILQVGTDADGNRYRSFLRFNISDLPFNMFIARATLTLTSHDLLPFDYLEIDSASKDYEEYGQTWASQVARSRILDIVSLEGNISQYKIDVTDIVANTWYGRDFDNHGFILKGYDESIKQLKQFLSKESLYPPVLEVNYMDLVSFSFGTEKLTGNVHVAKRMYSDALAGKVDVKRYYDESMLPSNVHVQNKEMLEATVEVSRARIKAYVQVKEFNLITGSVQVRAQGVPSEIDGSVLINHNILKSKVYIKDRYDIVSSVIVGNFNTLPSNVYVNNNIIKGKVEVRALYGLTGSVLLNRRHDGISSWVVVNGNQVIGKINIRDKSTVTGFVKVKTNSDLISTVAVRPFAQLMSNVFVKYVSGITGTVQAGGLDSLVSSVHVATHDNKGMTGSVKPRVLSQLQSHVQVNSQFLHAEVTVKGYNGKLGRVTVKTFDTLNCNVDVFYRNQIYGNVWVRQLWFNDITGSVNVGGVGLNRNYAFIM